LLVISTDSIQKHASWRIKYATVCVCVNGFNVQSVFDRKSKRIPTVQIKDKAHYLNRARLCGLLEENFSLYAFSSGKPVVYSV